MKLIIYSSASAAQKKKRKKAYAFNVLFVCLTDYLFACFAALNNIQCVFTRILARVY